METITKIECTAVESSDPSRHRAVWHCEVTPKDGPKFTVTVSAELSEVAAWSDSQNAALEAVRLALQNPAIDHFSERHPLQDGWEVRISAAPEGARPEHRRVEVYDSQGERRGTVPPYLVAPAVHD